MIHAYKEHYLDDAIRNLGEAFDFAHTVGRLELDNFFAMFINSGIAELLGSGHPKYVAGLSGTELEMEVMRKSGLSVDGLQAQTEYDYSPEYWAGWALAYFQWFTKRSFKNIAECITMQEILQFYPTLHEASEEKFVETITRLIRNKNLPTRLQKRRKDARAYAKRTCRAFRRKIADNSAIRNAGKEHQQSRRRNLAATCPSPVVQHGRLD